MLEEASYQLTEFYGFGKGEFQRFSVFKSFVAMANLTFNWKS